MFDSNKTAQTGIQLIQFVGLIYLEFHYIFDECLCEIFRVIVLNQRDTTPQIQLEI